MAQPADPRDDDLVAKFSDPQLAHQFAETAPRASPPPSPSRGSPPPLSKASAPPPPALLRRPRSVVIAVVVVLFAGLAIALLVTYLSR